MQLFT